jgi:hypothetical protein
MKGWPQHAAAVGVQPEASHLCNHLNVSSKLLHKHRAHVVKQHDACLAVHVQQQLRKCGGIDTLSPRGRQRRRRQS